MSKQIFTTVQLGLNTSTGYHHIQTCFHSDGGSQTYGVGSTTEFIAKLRMPTSGTLRNLRIDLQSGSSVGEGETWTWTVRKNESDQSLSVELSEGETSETDSSNEVSFSAGDQISVKCVPTGSPGSVIYFSMCLEAEYDGSDNYTVVSGGFQDTIVTQYSPLGIYMSNNSTTTDTDKNASMPFPGTIRAIYGDLEPGKGPGAGTTRRITYTGGVGSDSLTFAEDAVTVSDTSVDEAFSQGDTCRLISVAVSSPTATYVRYSMLIETDEGYEGYNFMCGGYNGSPSNEYLGFNGLVGDGSTEYKFYVGPTGFTMKNVYINCDTVDANGDQTVTVRKNGADTSLSASTGSLSSSGSDTSNSVDVVEGDYINARYEQSGDNEPGNYNLAQVVSSSSRRVFNIT